jgi:hypothetical protein
LKTIPALARPTQALWASRAPAGIGRKRGQRQSTSHRPGAFQEPRHAHPRCVVLSVGKDLCSSFGSRHTTRALRSTSHRPGAFWEPRHRPPSSRFGTCAHAVGRGQVKG